jgi:hypothetical protein
VFSWRERGTYRMVLPVLNRIHCGIGLFCFCALASFCFVRKDLWLCVMILISLLFSDLDNLQMIPSSRPFPPSSPQSICLHRISFFAIKKLMGGSQLTGIVTVSSLSSLWRSSWSVVGFCEVPSTPIVPLGFFALLFPLPLASLSEIQS